MLYRVLYVIGQLSLAQYFRAIHRLGAAPAEKGPLVLVANHFNGLLDALLILASFWRKCWVTGKSTLFEGTAGRILRHLPVIAVNRPKNGEAVDNAEMFQRTSKELGRGGAILVFPYEFPSDFRPGERKLHKFKTGAVRMAFQAEEEAGWTLGVKLQPVGINYADFTRVGASATLVFGEPVLASDFRDDVDPRQAVRRCAEEIDARMHRLCVEIPTQAYSRIIEDISRLFEAGSRDDYSRLSLIARRTREIAPLYPDLAERFEAQIEQYLTLCEKLDLPPGAEDLPLTHRWRIALFAPLTLFGWITHLPADLALTALANRWKGDAYYTATIKFLLGLIGFPIWYAIVFAMGVVVSENLVGPTLFLLAMAAAGFVVNRYGYRLNLLLTAMIPSRRAAHLRELRSRGAELRAALRRLAETPIPPPVPPVPMAAGVAG